MSFEDEKGHATKLIEPYFCFLEGTTWYGDSWWLLTASCNVPSMLESDLRVEMRLQRN